MKLKNTFQIAAKTENSAAKTSAARDKANTNASGDQGWSSSICIMVREYQIVDQVDRLTDDGYNLGER